MAEGVGDALEREMSVDHRFDSIDIDRPHHVLLLHAIADSQADDLELLAHDGDRRDRPSITGQDSDQGMWPPNRLAAID